MFFHSKSVRYENLSWIFLFDVRKLRENLQISILHHQFRYKVEKHPPALYLGFEEEAISFSWRNLKRKEAFNIERWNDETKFISDQFFFRLEKTWKHPFDFYLSNWYKSNWRCIHVEAFLVHIQSKFLFIHLMLL